MPNGECWRRGAPTAASPAQRGFTYLIVLFIVAGLGLFVGQAGVVWQQVAQREKEEDLLAIGAEIARAIGSYQRASADNSLPRKLEDLLDDRRSGVMVRHLRRIYRDPFTGQKKWGLEAPGGLIAGVYSLAPGAPIRRKNLPPELSEKAQDATRYAEWVFHPTDDSEAPGLRVP